jgi:hypothetical protein
MPYIFTKTHPSSKTHTTKKHKNTAKFCQQEDHRRGSSIIPLLIDYLCDRQTERSISMGCKDSKTEHLEIISPQEEKSSDEFDSNDFEITKFIQV